VLTFQLANPNIIKFQVHPSLIRLQEQHMQALFESPSVCQEFFPHNLIHVEYLVLGTEMSNMRHIINDNTRVFATVSNPKGEPAKLAFRSEQVRLLTLGLNYPVQGGRMVSIAAYGNNQDSFEDHVQAHLNELVRCDVLFLSIMVPKSLPYDIARNTFQKYGNGSFVKGNTYNLVTFSRVLKSGNIKSKY